MPSTYKPKGIPPVKTYSAETRVPPKPKGDASQSIKK